MSTKAAGKLDHGARMPKLRFPEFRQAPGWKAVELKDLSRVGLSNGVFNDPKNVGTGYKLVNVLDMYIDTPIVEDRLSLLQISASEFESNQVEHGDIFFTRSSLVKSGIAVSNIYLGDANDVTFDGHLIRFRADVNKVIPLFLHYLLKTAPVRVQLIARGKTATMTTIGQSDVAGISVYYPDKDEQQKIVDCLGSLDDVIVTHHQKLDALKTHKKGLLQQLFTRDGEAVPLLRFPEFQNAGVWKSERLGKLLLGTPEYGVNAAAVPYSDKLPKYIRITDISDDGFYLSDTPVAVDIEPTDANYLDDGDIVLARTGASVGKSYRYRLEDGKLVFAGFLIRVKPDKKRLVPAYLANFLTTEQFWDWVATTSARSGQPGINSTEYSSLAIPLPPDLSEQQRIADCLSSLDELIAAQNRKLLTLKIHKKGLMQQLFPYHEEVEA